MNAPQSKSGSPMGRLVVLVVLLAVAGGALFWVTTRKPSEAEIRQKIQEGAFYEPGMGKAEAAELLGLTEADAQLIPKDPAEDTPGEYYLFEVPTSEGIARVRIRVQGGGQQVTRAELVDERGEVIELELPEDG